MGERGVAWRKERGMEPLSDEGKGEMEKTGGRIIYDGRGREYIYLII